LCGRHKKGAQEAEALGRSRGGFTTKLHARCDAKGRPLGFVLTPGQTHDIQGFAPLFRMISDRIEAVIPSKSNRREPIPHDKAKYKWRNQIERLFNKLKNWRRIGLPP
jgi:transposase